MVASIRMPNGMQEMKATYVRTMLIGRPANSVMSSAALWMYHAEVPMGDAAKYMDTYQAKREAEGYRLID